jgi:putative nucleotidyltransferase with HDIG domain
VSTAVFKDIHGNTRSSMIIRDVSDRKLAEEEAKRHLARVQAALMHTVEVATTLSEMRDPYTAGHEKRVAQIAVAIAREMGFDEGNLEGLEIAGYLHDIGKITIPSEILSKPGRLSAAEFELVKGHAQASYEVLKNVEFPWPVADMVHQHHERIDGSGYPRGLTGAQMLPGARVLAVADVVEAMASRWRCRRSSADAAGLSIPTWWTPACACSARRDSPCRNEQAPAVTLAHRFSLPSAWNSGTYAILWPWQRTCISRAPRRKCMSASRRSRTRYGSSRTKSAGPCSTASASAFF